MKKSSLKTQMVLSAAVLCAAVLLSNIYILFISKEMQKITGIDKTPLFSPLTTDYYSGMVVEVPLYTDLLSDKKTPAEIRDFLASFYEGEKFIRVMPLGAEAETGNVLFSDDEVRNLRTYLMAGGFLHIDDNYGIGPSVRREMKKVFPELDFVELPFTHPIYHQKYQFPNGLPKIHEHDNLPPKGYGLIWEGRLVCFFTWECDLGDGWEDPDVHNDSQGTRQKAFRMGENILQYVFSN